MPYKGVGLFLKIVKTLMGYSESVVSISYDFTNPLNIHYALFFITIPIDTVFQSVLRTSTILTLLDTGTIMTYSYCR